MVKALISKSFHSRTMHSHIHQEENESSKSDCLTLNWVSGGSLPAGNPVDVMLNSFWSVLNTHSYYHSKRHFVDSVTQN